MELTFAEFSFGWFLMLSLSFSILTDVNSEDNPSVESERILDGTVADEGQFPFMVALYETDSSGGRFTCSATLISQNTVLTAGHCVVSDNDETLPADHFFGIAGSANRSIETGVKFSFSRIQVHPEYSRTRNDVAFCTVSSPVKFTPNIQPLCLSGSSCKQKKCTIAGWGKHKRFRNVTEELRYNDHQLLLGSLLCRLRYHIIVDTATQFCGDGLGRGPCYGDSGGPCLVYTSEGIPVHCGLVSYGLPLLCDTSVIGPIVYSKASAIIGWLRKETGDKDICIV